MGVFFRCASRAVLVVGVALIAQVSLAEQTLILASGGTKSCIEGQSITNPNYCTFQGNNRLADFMAQCGVAPGWDYAACETSSESFECSSDTGTCTWLIFRTVACNAPEGSHVSGHTQGEDGRYYCVISDGPPPEPECGIPAGTKRSLSATPLRGSVCASNCRFKIASPARAICVELSSGHASCSADYVSTGEYCEPNDAEDRNPPPGDPGDPGGDDGSGTGYDCQGPICEVTDDEGCIRSVTGDVYCHSPPDDGCSNYVTIDGNKFCRTSERDSDRDGVPDDWDSDGDGIPDVDDPDPVTPCQDDECPPPGEDEGEGETSQAGEGICEPGAQIEEPACSSALDAIMCANFLQNWWSRCDAKAAKYEIFGEADYREGDSVLGDHDANFAAHGTVDMSGIFTDVLDEGLVSIGGSCPASAGFTFLGGSYSIDYQPLCELASAIRPFVIALGYLVGVIIIIGRIRG